MKNLFYSQVDKPNIQDIRKDIHLNNPNTITFFCETEWDFVDLDNNFAQLCNSKNIHLVLVFGSYNSEFYNKKFENFKSVEIINWYTYWFNWTMMCSTMFDFNITYEKFDYPFICLNNKNHTHRCALIDELTRNNLLDKGVVTWHKFPNNTTSYYRPPHLPSTHGEAYKFKYYDDSMRIINDDFATKLDSFLIPDQYYKSFLHVIGEATLTVPFITEKTCLPILFKKPWIIMADQYFHKKLVDLGFELYDEIIDYSFDSEPNFKKRAYAISENVKNICSQDIQRLYEIIKPKADRNYNNYMRIIRSEEYVPKLIKERGKNFELEPNRTFTDNRYFTICKMVGILNDS